MIPFSTENGSNEDFLLFEDVAGENGCGSAGECVKRNEIRRSRTARRWWRNQIRDLRFVRVANHKGHAGECGNFFGGALRVAAGDDDSRGGAAGVRPFGQRSRHRKVPGGRYQSADTSATLSDAGGDAAADRRAGSQP